MTFNARIEMPTAGPNEYTVRHQDGCTLIFGSVPLSEIASLIKRAPKKSMLEPTLARMAGANLAYGLRADLDALIEKMKPEALAREKSRRAGSGLSDAAIEWLAVGERGMSSETLFQHLTGRYVRGGTEAHHPYDTDDVRRCRLMLEKCPEIAAKFAGARTLSPTWARLVDAWPAICTEMDRDAPNWRDADRKIRPTKKTDQLISAAVSG